MMTILARPAEPPPPDLDKAVLLAEIERLRVRAYRTSDAQSAALAEWFGISGKTADLLNALYRAKGAVQTRSMLARATGLTLGGVNVAICTIRAVMDPDSVDSGRHDGHGTYALSQIGLDDCSEAIIALLGSNDTEPLTADGRR
jgi:hypothetical protein